MSRLMMILAAMTLFACAEGPAPDVATPEAPAAEIVDREMTLVAEVALDNGNTAEFWEMAPGHVMYAEVGQMLVVPTYDRETLAAMGTEALFRDLVPEGPLPAAIERAALREAAIERPALVSKTPDLVPKRWDAWFQSTFCSVGNADFAWCWLNRASATSFRRNDVFYFYAVVLANTGTVTFYMRKYDWWNGTRTIGSWDVPEGYYRYQSYVHGGVDDPDVWAGVTNVSGADRYDFAGHGVD